MNEKLTQAHTVLFARSFFHHSSCGAFVRTYEFGSPEKSIVLLDRQTTIAADTRFTG